MFREYYIKDPFHAREELSELEAQGWVPVCPTPLGDGYLMHKEGKE